MKKSKIEEIIDGDGNLIGSDDQPRSGADRETEANKTTDYNANVHGQNFKNDFLGRFGFYFYESEGGESKNKDVEDTLAKIMYEKYKETLDWYYKNPEKLKSDWELHQNTTFENQPDGSKEHDYEWASDILKALAPHMKKSLDEGKVSEDSIVKKKSDKLKEKKDDDHELSARAKKIVDLITDLPKDQKDKLMNIIEKK